MNHEPNRASSRTRCAPRVVAVLLALVAVAACSDDEPSATESSVSAVPVSTAPVETSPPEPLPPAGGGITIAVPEALDVWDTAALTTVTDLQVVKEVIEPLVVLSKDGSRIEPGLADSWSQEGDALTFVLPAGATFSDGSSVTSADVKFSIEALLAGPAAGSYSAIRAVETPDRTTAVLRLKAPDTSLLAALTRAPAGIVKADFGGRTRDQYFAEPVGSGPFTVGSHSADEVVLVKNPNYHRSGLPLLDRITYRRITDPDEAVQAFQQGSVDVVDRVPMAQLATLDESVVFAAPSAGVTSLLFNLGAAPASDERFRAAVSSAIDRVALASSVAADHARPAESVLPPYLPGSVSCASCSYLTPDASGLASVSSTGPIDVLVDSSKPDDLAVATALADSLTASGLRVNVAEVDSSTMASRRSSGDFVMAVVSYAAVSPTLNDPLDAMIGTLLLDARAPLDAAQAARTAIAGAEDDLARSDAAVAFERATFESHWLSPLVTIDHAAVLAADVQGLVVHPLLITSLRTVALIR